MEQAQRVRLSREMLRLEPANCMDVSMVFASAVENLGMQPLLVIVPGHGLGQTPVERVLVVDVAAARVLGIYPLADPGPD